MKKGEAKNFGNQIIDLHLRSDNDDSDDDATNEQTSLLAQTDSGYQ